MRYWARGLLISPVSVMIETKGKRKGNEKVIVACARAVKCYQAHGHLS